MIEPRPRLHDGMKHEWPPASPPPIVIRISSGVMPAMHEARLGQRVRALAVLPVVLAVAVLADAFHALDRTLGVAKRKFCASSRVQPAPATMRMCSGARITTLWPSVMQP